MGIVEKEIISLNPINQAQGSTKTAAPQASSGEETADGECETALALLKVLTKCHSSSELQPAKAGRPRKDAGTLWRDLRFCRWLLPKCQEHQKKYASMR